MGLLSQLDLIIFFGSIFGIMALGLWAGRKEETSDDYYLAAHGTRWWGVAGSIFGSNVSANHIVGMMGIGFAVGFAQSHFEITAIVGLLMLCFLFLPVYRKLRVYTLSEYLARRYGESSRLAYALIMMTIMVVIQMVPGFYIGSRSLNLLIFDYGATAAASAVVNKSGEVTAVRIVRGGSGYAEPPAVAIAGPPKDSAGKIGQAAAAAATLKQDGLAEIKVTNGGSGYDPKNPPAVAFKGGAAFNTALSPDDVDPKWYVIGILLMAVVTGTYTIFGGLKAVIVTDVIQSLLLLTAGLVVASFTFSQPEINGWIGMSLMDASSDKPKLGLYEPTWHPELPWSGVLSGLMVLHFFYWGANQFIVQRALSATSDNEARMGIIAAGFFKLLIPFFAIGTGIAAFYLFQADRFRLNVAQDAVFVTLLTKLIAPVGFGLVGLVAAGMMGAILSSLDSMMNSAATIFTFDIYKRYLNPQASEKQLIWVGRLCILISIVGATVLTIFTMDPNSESGFFLYIANHMGRLVAGVVVVFLLGMLWPRGTAAGAITAIIAGVVFSYGLPELYNTYLGPIPAVAAIFGEKVNFLHAVFVAAILSALLHIVVSLCTTPDEEKGQLTWIGLGIFTPAGLKEFGLKLAFTLSIYAILALFMVWGQLAPFSAATIAAAATLGGFFFAAIKRIKAEKETSTPLDLLKIDLFWAGLLASCAIFMMYYFYLPPKA